MEPVRKKTVAFLSLGIILGLSVIAMTSTKIRGETSLKTDPFAFFVGKVQQSFTEGKSKAEAKDIKKYVDREKGVIKSITNEIEWDYKKGIMVINTEKSQGATGFLNREPAIELNDIIISSQNEYGSILVISLDDKPIKDSGKILIQVMTEERPYGWQESGNVIQNLGSFPTNIKNINAVVTFKNRDSVKKVTVLDENGYPQREIAFSKAGGNIEIKLAPDALYTIVE